MSEIGDLDYGRFEYWVNDPRSCGRDDDDYGDGRNGDRDGDYGRARCRPSARFEATTIASVVFSDDPAFWRGRDWRKPGPTADSVVFSGSGRLNGAAGFTFTVTATDQGEPGRTATRSS